MNAAVVYVCAEKPDATFAQERAIDEGLDFADRHGFTFTVTITDHCREPAARSRECWQRVRAVTASGEMTTVNVRWLNLINHATRTATSRSTAARNGVVGTQSSWAPLAIVTCAEGP
ncbi:hypothetical protein [Streptomyces sp. NPDC056549]|uniref:hypothetical protein n=1 Tax=Streptomyces sp. NPDC056549 TaxID=3345864 RepID=UPI0036B8E9E1